MEEERRNMKCCKDCDNRYVGCHARCQKYIVAKTIHTYKRDKLSKEKELAFNDGQYGRLCQESMKRHSDFKRKTFKG